MIGEMPLRALAPAALLALALALGSGRAVAAPPGPAAPPSPGASRSTATAAAATQVLAGLNDARRAQGLPSLAPSAGLAAAAAQHAREMVSLGYFAHDSSDGTAFWRRIARSYPSRGCSRWAVGETLYWTAGGAAAAAVAAAWLASPEHRRILLGDWAEVGVGIAQATVAPGVFGGRTVTVVVADFGSCGG